MTRDCYGCKYHRIELLLRDDLDLNWPCYNCDSSTLSEWEEKEIMKPSKVRLFFAVVSRIIKNCILTIYYIIIDVTRSIRDEYKNTELFDESIFILLSLFYTYILIWLFTHVDNFIIMEFEESILQFMLQCTIITMCFFIISIAMALFSMFFYYEILQGIKLDIKMITIDVERELLRKYEKKQQAKTEREHK